MTATFRPMSLGEILDHTFQIYRSYFVVLLGLAVLPLAAQMALILVGFPFDGLIRQTTISVTVQRQLVDSHHWIATHFSSSFLNFAMWPVFCAVAAQIVLRQECRIGDALQASRPRWRGLLMMAGIFCLLESVLPRWLHGPHSLGPEWHSMPVWLSFLMSPVEAFAFIAPLLLGFPIWTIERSSVVDSLARSWTLSKGAYGRMFITCLLQSVAIWSITLSIRGFLSLAFNFMSADQISDLMRASWKFLPNYLASVFAAPLFPIAITLIYYDQRIRLEGFDIEWMMDVAGMMAPEAPVTAASASIPARVVELASESRQQIDEEIVKFKSGVPPGEGLTSEPEEGKA